MVKVPRLIKIVILLVGFVGISLMANAQPGDPETNPDVPISGIEILLGLGGLWGARKYAQRRKKRQDDR